MGRLKLQSSSERNSNVGISNRSGNPRKELMHSDESHEILGDELHVQSRRVRVLPGLTESQVKKTQYDTTAFELATLVLRKKDQYYAGINSVVLPYKAKNQQENDDASSSSGDSVADASLHNINTQDQSSLEFPNTTLGNAQASHTIGDTSSGISMYNNVENLQRGESLADANGVVPYSSEQHMASLASIPLSEEENKADGHYRHVKFAEGTVYITGKTVGKPLGSVRSKSRLLESSKKAVRSIVKCKTGIVKHDED